MLSNKEDRFRDAKRALEAKFGPVDMSSSIMDFSHTDYYEEEFGSGLKRLFLTFKKTLPVNNIFEVKLVTCRLENRFFANNKRQVNIDPGYLSLSKLVLFSTKDYSHRIHLGKGIFAEVTLRFEKHSFMPWPWTYPDYATKEYIDFFNAVRQCYSKQLKGEA